MAGGRCQVEQVGKVPSNVRVVCLVNKQAGRGAGLEVGADLGLEGVDMLNVPAIGRHLQIVGIEDRNLDAAILDRRAPVGSLQVAVRTRGGVAGEIVDCLLKASRATLFVYDAVGDDEQHFLRRVARFV